MSEDIAKSISRFSDDPENPGWKIWQPLVAGRFLDLFGPVRVTAEGERTLRCRVETGMRHSNGYDAVHGGFIMAIVDMALFWGAHYFELFEGGGGVTLETSTQFMGASRAGEPVDAVVEVLKTTGRLIFLRGVIEQGGAPMVNFSGTLRKVGAKPFVK